MQTIYIAEDGTPFKQEQECLVYEQKQEKILMYDGDLEKCYSYYDCRFLCCPTRDTAQRLWNKYCGCSTTLPWEDSCDIKPGCWFWNEESCKWVNMEEVIETLFSTLHENK